MRQLQAYMPGKAFIAECQRQSDVLDDALLNALCLPEGEALGIEQMSLEQAKTVLAGEFETGKRMSGVVGIFAGNE